MFSSVPSAVTAVMVNCVSPDGAPAPNFWIVRPRGTTRCITLSPAAGCPTATPCVEGVSRDTSPFWLAVSVAVKLRGSLSAARTCAPTSIKSVDCAGAELPKVTEKPLVTPNPRTLKCTEPAQCHGAGPVKSADKSSDITLSPSTLSVTPPEMSPSK